MGKIDAIYNALKENEGLINYLTETLSTEDAHISFEDQQPWMSSAGDLENENDLLLALIILISEISSEDLLSEFYQRKEQICFDLLTMIFNKKPNPLSKEQIEKVLGFDRLNSLDAFRKTKEKAVSFPSYMLMNFLLKFADQRDIFLSTVFQLDDSLGRNLFKYREVLAPYILKQKEWRQILPKGEIIRSLANRKIWQDLGDEEIILIINEVADQIRDKTTLIAILENFSGRAELSEKITAHEHFKVFNYDLRELENLAEINPTAVNVILHQHALEIPSIQDVLSMMCRNKAKGLAAYQLLLNKSDYAEKTASKDYLGEIMLHSNLSSANKIDIVKTVFERTSKEQASKKDLTGFFYMIAASQESFYSKLDKLVLTSPSIIEKTAPRLLYFRVLENKQWGQEVFNSDLRGEALRERLVQSCDGYDIASLLIQYQEKGIEFVRNNAKDQFLKKLSVTDVKRITANAPAYEGLIEVQPSKRKRELNKKELGGIKKMVTSKHSFWQADLIKKASILSKEGECIGFVMDMFRKHMKQKLDDINTYSRRVQRIANQKREVINSTAYIHRIQYLMQKANYGQQQRELITTINTKEQLVAFAGELLKQKNQNYIHINTPDHGMGLILERDEKKRVSRAIFVDANGGEKVLFPPKVLKGLAEILNKKTKYLKENFQLSAYSHDKSFYDIPAALKRKAEAEPAATQSQLEIRI
ncbi:MULTISPECIES: hypothetical protein [unclassified Legionella]|uniref:hypothetical protein n=1 Tax=unclassified Legionella TaxID=2622702 RepID=UPI0010566199|nr:MULTISPECIES: hypothetical protein [unclassified Legionella]MDI9819686.1 hypothetical protein [Legionella sp. PL877]